MHALAMAATKEERQTGLQNCSPADLCQPSAWMDESWPSAG